MQTMAINASPQFVLKISKYCNLRCDYCYEFPHLGDKARMAASSERFKVVAAMQGEQRRQRSAFNQQKSMLEIRLQEKEALAATQAATIKQLEGVRDELDKRFRVIEALLTSEREAAERKTRRTADGPPETAAARAAG